MKMLANIEFYNTPEGEVMMHDAEGVRVFTDKERDVIMQVIIKLTEFYPEALAYPGGSREAGIIVVFLNS